MSEDNVIELDERKESNGFIKEQEQNKKIKEREAEERKKHNEKVLRQYRIKRKQ